MTIAAGLLCKEGVLLCADTELTDWETKSQGSKIRQTEFPGGKAVFAFAGNVRFAVATLQKFERALKEKHPKKLFDPLVVMEDVLEREYRRHVLKHPDSSTNTDLHYSVLIALWTPGGKVRLFISSYTVISEVFDYEMMGIGEPLARHLVRPVHYKEMPYAEALPLATYALRLVKDSIKDCDGLSVFSLLGNDGTISTVTSMHPGPCLQVERYAKGYDFLTTRLLMGIANPRAEPQHVMMNVEIFKRNVDRIFQEMLAERMAREKEIEELNPRMSPTEVKQLVAQLSMGLLPTPPPSPESPGGSGES